MASEAAHPDHVASSLGIYSLLSLQSCIYNSDTFCEQGPNCTADHIVSYHWRLLLGK